MRVTFVNLWHDQPDPEAQMRADPLRRELSRALARRGHAVTVVQEHPMAGTRLDGAVRWVFAPPGPTARLGRALLARRADAMVKAPAPHVLRPIAASRPEIIHSFDLAFYPTLAMLGLLARHLDAALIAHFHGGAPARNPLLRAVERAALRSTHRLLFTAAEQGSAWVASGALPDDRKIAQVFETSSTFSPGNRAEARARTGLDGDPAILHVGRLDPVKDPLTAVRGFAAFARAHPGARLHLVWTDAPLEAAVRAAAAGLPIVFHGRKPPDAMEDLHRSADLFLAASAREVCGRAVLEALACGTAPVLSDIPPFRQLTDQGRVGRLFRPGDPGALATALADADAARRAGSLATEAVRAWFDAALSFEALADAVEEVYRGALRG